MGLGHFTQVKEEKNGEGVRRERKKKEKEKGGERVIAVEVREP